MICKYCHREIPDGSPFCPFCGKSLKEKKLQKTSIEEPSQGIPEESYVRTQVSDDTEKENNYDGKDNNTSNEDYENGENKENAIVNKNYVDTTIEQHPVKDDHYKDSKNERNEEEKNKDPEEEEYSKRIRKKLKKEKDKEEKKYALPKRKKEKEPEMTDEEKFRKLDEINGDDYSSTVYAPVKPQPGRLPESTYAKILRGFALIAAVAAVALVALYFI